MTESIQERSLKQACGGYVDEMDEWMTMMRHFCNAKLPDDPDWAILVKIFNCLNMGNVRSIEKEKIFNIIEFNRINKKKE